MKRAVIIIALVGYCADSHGQSLMKTRSREGYDNINLDRQRDQQLMPTDSRKYTPLKQGAVFPMPSIAKLSGNIPINWLNNQKVVVPPMQDYTGKGNIKTK